VLGNRRFQWRVNYNVAQDQAACAYDASTGVNPCFGLGHIDVTDTLVAGAAAQDAAGNDIAVLGGPNNARLSPSYSVFTATNVGDGTSGSNNRAGTQSDFASAYANGQNGALKQLVFAVEQSIVKGAPVLEVQEPTVATTAAAFDEGGNFIDLRFGPLTRGTCNSALTFTSPECSQTWADFGTYQPTLLATAGNFAGGQTIAPTGNANQYSLFVRTLVQNDRNGVARGANWVRGALQQ